MKTIVDRPLRIGDRIKVILEFAGLPMTNQKGTIKEIISSENIIVEFDKPFPQGHDCSGKCKDNRGRYGNIKDIKRLYTRLYKDLFGNIV